MSMCAVYIDIDIFLLCIEKFIGLSDDNDSLNLSKYSNVTK